jgi:CheY-like chemotaxis protein/HD-like signal output (HDOD) protein
MAEATKIQILVVEDQEKLRRICRTVLEKSGYEVVDVEGAYQALLQAQTQKFDLVLTDYKIPGATGDELIDRLKEIQPEIMAILMTAYPSMDLAVNAIKKGVCEFITKPFDIKTLRAAIQKAVDMMESGVAPAHVQAEVPKAVNAPPPAPSPARPKPSSSAAQDKSKDRESESPTVPPNAIVVIVCEAIPPDRKRLQASGDYAHFRSIYSAHKSLSSQLQNADLPADMHLLVANHSADISRHLRAFSDQVCCVIFGPNWPLLSEATIRMMANSGKDRELVVCHNPTQANFSWEKLTELGEKMDVKGCNGLAEENEIKEFWADFFGGDLKAVVQNRAGMSPSEMAAQKEMLSVKEVQDLLEKDATAMEVLPGLPHICQQAIQAIDEGKNYATIAGIIQPDGGLQASLVRTSNLARYEVRQRVQTLPNALPIIGMEETKKIIMGKAMSDMVNKISQTGFDTRDFFRHCTSVGYMAQILHINVESPSPKEQEILQSLRLPEYVCSILKTFRCWDFFKKIPAFDSFTAGILHDVGKVLNAVCYEGIFPLILYDIEQSEWKGGLLQSEQAVVGHFHHPATGSALLDKWDIFPALVDSIRHHHQVQTTSSPDLVLVALANCLVKGLYPFPSKINIPARYRKTHLLPTEGVLVDNPVLEAYQRMADVFDMHKSQVPLSPGERETGHYQAKNVEGVISAAREAVRLDSKAYMFVLIDQNPEFLDIVEWTKASAEDLFALSLLLKDSITERVNDLFRSTR